MRSFLESLESSTKHPNPHLTGLFIAILLDCESHASFTRLVDLLKAAGSYLYDVAFDYRTRTQINDLEAKDPLIAARVCWYNSVTAQFKGRCLLWTERGFHAVASPGVEFCRRATVLLLDGLSIPMMVKDFDEEKGHGRLVGCALVRGVDLHGGYGDRPEVPAGFSLGQKTFFKFM